jgi:hypothetical protein
MQQITLTLDDQAYRDLSTEATRHNLNMDTYAAAVLMEKIGKRESDIDSPLQSGIGLFADVPELVDAVLADIMESRARRWQDIDDESNS